MMHSSRHPGHRQMQIGEDDLLLSVSSQLSINLYVEVGSYHVLASTFERIQSEKEVGTPGSGRGTQLIKRVGIDCVALAVLELTEICLSLPTECWDSRCVSSQQESIILI